MARKRSESPINIDVKAGARIDVKAEVPPTSVGRFVDAVTDLFRPFSEARGLRADQIRLQRADVAIEIAKRARAALAVENMEASPVPNKILIPLIEKASNESLTDAFMMDRWAHLLATASAANEVEPRFVGILGELNGKQAKALEKIARNSWEYFELPIRELHNSALDLNLEFVRRGLNDFFAHKQSSPAIDEIYDHLDWINRPGGVAVDIIINEDEESYSLPQKERLLDFSSRTTSLDVEILASLGLVKHVEFWYNSKFKHEIFVIYYHITRLGIDFFLSCNRGME